MGFLIYLVILYWVFRALRSLLHRHSDLGQDNIESKDASQELSGPVRQAYGDGELLPRNARRRNAGKRPRREQGPGIPPKEDLASTKEPTDLQPSHSVLSLEDQIQKRHHDMAQKQVQIQMKKVRTVTPSGRVDQFYDALMNNDLDNDISVESQVSRQAGKNTLTSRQLRRAIVTAEILAKPKSLREG